MIPPSRTALVVVGVLSLSACTGSGASPESSTERSCPASTLTVTVPEVTFTARGATSVVSRRVPAVVDVWIADYASPDPAATLVPRKPAVPSGHARVRLQLLAAPGTKVDGPGRYPAMASKQPGVGRATLIVESASSQHGAYSNIQGEATVTTYDDHELCGSFRIGDDVTSASGTFRARY